MTARTPAFDCAVSLVRLALDECETAAADMRAACDGADNPAYDQDYLLGTVSVVEASLGHALDVARAAKTVLLPARAAGIQR